MAGKMNKPNQTPKVNFNTLDIYGDPRRIKNIYTLFCIVTLVSMLGGVIIVAAHKDWLQVIFMAASIPVVLISLFCVLKNKFELASIILTTLFFFLITLISTLGLGIHAISNFAFPVILIIVSLVIRKRTLVFLFIFAVVCVAWLVFGELLNLYKPTVLVRSVPGDFFTVLLILVSTVIMVRIITESLFKAQIEVKKELVERKRIEERLAHDALHDALTNLPNRTLFFDRLGQRFEHARRHPEDPFAILYIDLDRFKVINDSLGHSTGDQLLVETANRLSHCLRPEDTVARLSGDEFAILLNEFREISDAVHVAERIQSELSSSSMIEGYNRTTTASIGITISNPRYSNARELLRDADSAMYRAKAKGGGQYAIFDDTMHASAMALLRMEADLKNAVEKNEWKVFYQPIISLPDRRVIGAEALVRWMHPKKGMILPGNFIHVAEETGVILKMGKYVIDEACRQAQIWRNAGHPNFVISVNLSARQFQFHDLLKQIKHSLSEYHLAGDGLQLELTETVAMKDLAYSTRVLNNLNRLGIAIALDDFGNGYSSFGYLNRFPIKIVKIDQSFIQNVDKDKNNETISKAIISMSHTLNLDVVAEGVESERQLKILESMNCDKIQGNFICKAIPADQFSKQLLNS